MGYTPAHLEKSMANRSQHQLSTGSGLFQGSPSRSQLGTTSRVGFTPVHKKSALQSDSASDKCLFTSHLMLETDELYFEPSKDDFKTGMSETLVAFQDCTLAFPNLLPDAYFHSFTR